MCYNIRASSASGNSYKAKRMSPSPGATRPFIRFDPSAYVRDKQAKIKEVRLINMTKKFLKMLSFIFLYLCDVFRFLPSTADNRGLTEVLFIY